MTVRALRWLWLVVFLCPLADAQQAANDQDEMRFVDALRKQGYPDLALKYLDGLKKKPISKDLAAELPVEIAMTQLELAGDEPDIGRKLSLYADVRGKLQEYLKANPTSRRASEIELNIAEVAVLQGRMSLSEAMMLDESDSQETPERLKARALLKDAGIQLVTLDKKLKDQVKAVPEPKTPAERSARDRLERTEYQARFNIAMNYFDQGQSFPRYHPKLEVLQERGKRIVECRKELEQLVSLDGSNPVTAAIKWRSMAWLGRCFHELGDPTKARTLYAQVIDLGGRNPFASEGVRLAQYFRLLVIFEKADAGEDRVKLVSQGCDKWLRTYPRQVNTAEGAGCRFLLANITIERYRASKDAKEKAALLVQARRLLSGLEATENDFTERARHKKIQIIGEQGAFTKKVAELTTFEDCYVRAQYEQYETEKDGDKAQEKAKALDKSLEKLQGTELQAKTKEVEAKKKELEKQLEQSRKDRTETIMTALARGLTKPDAKSKQHLTEANTARTMLCYYYLKGEKFAECIQFGESFARDDPRSGQASKCAAYALQAYSMEMPKLPVNTDKGIEERKKMQDFARYCKKNWAKELPGDLARHQLAQYYLGEKKQDEAIAELNEITPGYPAYAATQWQLASELGKMIEAEPNRVMELRPKMLAVLERVPETAKGTPLANQAYYLIRCKLADEMYNSKQYDRMETIAAALEKDLDRTQFDENETKDKEMRGYFGTRIAISGAYSLYGRAKVGMDKGEFAKVTQHLDPVIDRVLAKKFDVLKGPNYASLANAIFDMDMKANIQQGKLDRTKLVVQALQSISEDAGGDVPPILKQLVPLIRQQVDELKKKGNQEALGKAIVGFSAILDELIKKQAKVNPEFQIALAQAYNGMTLHDKAADLLRKIPEPANLNDKAHAGDKDVQVYKAAQIHLIRALRAAKLYDEADKTMTAIMGEKAKPGWGLKSIDALKEKIALCLDKEDYNTAFNIATQLGTQLSRRTDDPRMKEQYVDVYYSMVVSLVRQSSKQKEDAKKKRGMDESARYIVQLEKRFPDLGGDASEKKFRELIASDPDLKAAYDAMKPKKP